MEDNYQLENFDENEDFIALNKIKEQKENN